MCTYSRALPQPCSRAGRSAFHDPSSTLRGVEEGADITLQSITLEAHHPGHDLLACQLAVAQAENLGSSLV